MPRRAVRKFSPELDLSHHYREVDQLPQPWDSTPLFPKQQPLEVEMGSGKGLFITAAAQQRPEHNFLGIELARKYASYSAAKITKLELPNAVMVQGDGLKVFREILPAASVTAVHVYFPDPWWKARHKKRRVLNEAFLRDAQRVLISGGKLHFWTDVEEYFQTTLELLAGLNLELEGPLEVPETAAEHDLDYRTHFERRTRLNAEPVYRAEFRRK
ncbi:MAG: tRNA (guanosine(46)-N7)-methyltransferase TrmB [Planctomycetota bacterium]|nr:tRNA (guanosine(46)-N7)-methyltransferase TrmB [Planctomycetota bacterium]